MQYFNCLEKLQIFVSRKWILTAKFVLINVSITSSVKEEKYPSMLSAFKVKTGVIVTIMKYDVRGSNSTYLILASHGSWNMYLHMCTNE